MKHIFFLSVIFGLPLFAQDLAETVSTPDAAASGWINTMSFSSGISQSHFANWSEGGDNSLTWQTSLKAKAILDKKTTAWESQADFQYGQTKLNDDPMRKSLDKIFLETLYRYKLTDLFSPYVSGRFESQFTAGYEYPDSLPRRQISSFMDPGYLTESVGMKYDPNKIFNSRLGFALKHTISDGLGWADDPDTKKVETSKHEPGLESISELTTGISEIISFNSRLSFFVNFKGTEQVDGRWENTVAIKAAEYFSLNFSLETLYDYDLDKDAQLRQGLTANLVYNLF
jgi:hypothetical protein